MSELKRSELEDDVFGIPEVRKYPLETKQHVLSAIKLFNHVDKKYEKELAENILKAIDKYKIEKDEIHITEVNRFYKYFNEAFEESVLLPIDESLDLFIESENDFNLDLLKSDHNMGKCIVAYTEDLYNKSYVTEATSNDLFQGLKKFFAEIISSIQTFIRNTQIEFNKFIRDQEVRIGVRKLRDKLKEDKSLGAKKTEIIDIWTLSKRYKEINSDLWSIAHRFAKTKYNKISNINNDIESFENLVDKYEKEIDELTQKKVTVSVDKALDFIEKEINGESFVFDSLNDDIAKLEEMERDCENLKIRLAGMHSDIIPEHVGIIKRISMNISRFITRTKRKLKNIIIKIMTALIIIF